MSNPTVIPKLMSDEWFGRNSPKTGRTIYNEHQQQQNNEDKGNITVGSGEIILCHHAQF
jgi:hypothetical protein